MNTFVLIIVMTVGGNVQELRIGMPTVESCFIKRDSVVGQLRRAKISVPYYECVPYLPTE